MPETPPPHADRARDDHARPPATDPDVRPDAPPARRRFVLARLAEAVRRQDWFTVLVEIAVVVLGVVIGFQVNAWGQARADRAKEQDYLRLLSAELADAEATLGEAIARNQAQLSAFDSFRTLLGTDTVIVDTSYRRMVRALQGINYPTIGSGTAQTLVATGDLRLIRSDSVRQSTVRFLTTSESYAAVHSELAIGEGLLSFVEYARASGLLTPGGHPYAVSAEDGLRSRELYDATTRSMLYMETLTRNQRGLLEVAEEASTRVEAELDESHP